MPNILRKPATLSLSALALGAMMLLGQPGPTHAASVTTGAQAPASRGVPEVQADDSRETYNRRADRRRDRRDDRQDGRRKERREERREGRREERRNDRQAQRDSDN